LPYINHDEFILYTEAHDHPRAFAFAVGSTHLIMSRDSRSSPINAKALLSISYSAFFYTLSMDLQLLVLCGSANRQRDNLCKKSCNSGLDCLLIILKWACIIVKKIKIQGITYLILKTQIEGSMEAVKR
jgi:hypothetical protein